MLIENVSIIISMAALVVTIIVTSTISIKMGKENYEMRLKFLGFEFSVRSHKVKLNEFTEILEADDISVEKCLDILYRKIKEIYPYSNFRITVKMLVHIDKSNLGESKLATVFSYPEEDIVYKNMPLYTIKDNTAFNSICESNCEYFFVSNLKEFSSFFEYKNEDRDYFRRWKTDIVCPIRKNNKEINLNDIIGFLGISFMQTLNNTKKNEIMMSYIKVVSVRLHEILLKESFDYKITKEQNYD